MTSSVSCGSVADMKAIERERLRRGWSRQALAMSLGTTGETVYRLERGRQKLTMDWLRRFAHSYGVHVSELLDDAEDETAPPSEPGESDARPESETDWDAVSAAVLPGVAVADTFTMEGDALLPTCRTLIRAFQ